MTPGKPRAHGGLPVLLLLLGYASSTTTPPPPNILILLADDLGHYDVGFHGSDAKTPFLDSLVAGPNTVHFSNYYGVLPSYHGQTPPCVAFTRIPTNNRQAI